MPTYEYHCDECNHELEEFQSIKDPPLKKCPVCGKSKLRRLISGGGGVVFKGSGFYSTDYRSESYKSSAKNDTAPAAAKSESSPHPASCSCCSAAKSCPQAS